MEKDDKLEEIRQRFHGQISRCIGGSFSAISDARINFANNAENDIRWLLSKVDQLTEQLEGNNEEK